MFIFLFTFDDFSDEFCNSMFTRVFTSKTILTIVNLASFIEKGINMAVDDLFQDF